MANAVGAFVSSSSGNDTTGDGTKQKPFATIGKALSGSKARVYICAGAYSENPHVTRAVALYGGFACADWSYDGAKPSIRGAAGSAALTVTGAQTVTVADVEIDGAAGTTPGASSLAMMIANSSAEIVRSELIAAAGQPGADAPSGGTFTPATAPAGNPGTGGGAGASQPNACASGPGSGGAGGSPSAVGASGGPGTPTITPPFPDAAHDGAGNTVAECKASLVGHAGSYGASGKAGDGAITYGALTGTGWTPASGQPGTAGGTGQGGGGGASVDGSGGGGGGGAGGCGGAGGGGGGGGGASVALALVGSSVHVDATTTLVAHDAGKGGAGGSGQVGQIGGSRGSATGPSGCQGGDGGHGGSGGGGGGGAGGLSVGILWTGMPPILDGKPVQDAPTRSGMTIPSSAPVGGMHGEGGAAPTAGANAGTPGTDGKPGLAQAVLGL